MQHNPVHDPFELEIRKAQAQLKAKQFADAEQTFRDILYENSDHPAANLGLGMLLHQAGADEIAIEYLQTTVTALPQNLDARFFLAVSLSNLKRFEESTEHYEQVIRDHPNKAEAHNNLGTIKFELGLYQQAEEKYLQALKLNSTLAEAHKNLGALYREEGRLEDARNYLEKAIACEPNFAEAHWYRTCIIKFTEYDDKIDAMETLYRQDNASDDDRISLAYALGKASHDLRQYPRAFQYWREANAILRRKLVDYSVEPALTEMREMKRVFSADFCASAERTLSTSPKLIFIVGMFRSGTTLTEQIIASHSSVYGAGELNTINISLREAVKNFPTDLNKLSPADWQAIREHYLENITALAGGAPCVTDKMPANFLHIGAISRLFPDAKIIHCRRNALSTGLSCFQNYFIKHQLGYACDLTDMGRYFQQYLDLMEYWERVQTASLYHIQYESLVTDTETEVRKLLEFCELPFEADCLAFHKTKRSVKTASAVQVRQPIYRDSLESWKHYEQELQPLKAALERRPGRLANYMSDMASRLRRSTH